MPAIIRVHDDEEYQAQVYAIAGGGGGAILHLRNPGASIALELPKTADIRILISELQGTLVRALAEENAQRLRGSRHRDVKPAA
jgi:hypothetical protein